MTETKLDGVFGIIFYGVKEWANSVGVSLIHAE